MFFQVRLVPVRKEKEKKIPRGFDTCANLKIIFKSLVVNYDDVCRRLFLLLLSSKMVSKRIKLMENIFIEWKKKKNEITGNGIRVLKKNTFRHKIV